MSGTVKFIAVSDLAVSRLVRTGTAVFHSAYRNTLNLMTPAGLIALQRAGSPLSPLSLITPFGTEGMEALASFAGKRIAVLPDGSLRLGGEAAGDGCVLRCGPQTAVFDPRVPSIGRFAAAALADTTRSMLSSAEGRGLAAVYSGPPSGDPVMAAVSGRLHNARSLLTQKKPKEAATALLGLIGLGGGLTPSGDDFLCGAAACLYAADLDGTDFARTLLAGIRSSLSGTNDISAAFLAAAADGLASDAVCAMFSGTKKADPSGLIRMFTEIGHSSGIDSLCGIDTVLHYIKDNLL